MDKNQAYSILSELIFKGFLIAELDFAGKPLIFKTINNRELDTIRILAGNPKSPSYTIRFNAYYLAFSVIAIEGINFLIDRHNKIDDLYKKFLEISFVLFKEILLKTNNLRAKSILVAKYLEGFCYTGQSRRMWKTSSHMFPNRHFLTGFQGTSELGMNIFQESWVLVNKSLDSEEEYDRQFNMALLIASASNPKGTRQIRNQHRGQMRNIEERRKKLADVGFIDEKQWRPDEWAAPVDTAEELVAELERQMHGVKDKHDVFIEDYMQKLKDETERKAREAENRIRRAREGLEDVFITSSQRELTTEETLKMLAQRQKKGIVSTPSESHTSENDKQRFLNKVSGRVLTARG